MKAVPMIAGDSDADLLARVASGELAALGALYDRHCAAVRGFVARATFGNADIDDLVHDTFLTAARIAARYDGRVSARPWLIGIAARLVQRRARGVARIARLVSRFAAGGRASSIDHAGELEARSVLAALGPAFARLSTAKRIVLLMSEVEEMSGAEISEALGIPINTVWTRLHNARRELVAALASKEPS